MPPKIHRQRLRDMSEKGVKMPKNQNAYAYVKCVRGWSVIDEPWRDAAYQSMLGSRKRMLAPLPPNRQRTIRPLTHRNRLHTAR